VPVAGNTVDSFVTPGDYYAALANAIRTCGVASGDFVYIAGWEIDWKTFMDPVGTSPRATLGDVLTAACQAKVQVRLLMDSGARQNRGTNTGAAQAVSKAGGGAIIDQFRQLTGSHHQKLAIIRAGDTVTAFCGGMDIANSRLGRDGTTGDGSPSGDAPSAPWHDVQVALRGPAAVDIWQSFVQRWQNTTAAVASAPIRARIWGLQASIYGSSSITAPVQQDAASTSQGGNLTCQVVRTYPNESGTHFGISGEQIAPYTRPFTLGYSFAPNGEHGILDLIVRAINMAEETIYLEDQYMVESAPFGTLKAITESLAATIAKPSFKMMVIAILGTPSVQTEIFQAASRRKDFYSQLGSLASSKVAIYQYKYDRNSPLWLHSKLWIFDDEFAVVSSANCNRRSYSNDSELGVGIQGPSEGSGPSFAKALRVRLWLKHLNAQPANGPASDTPVTASDVEDFASAAPLWAKAPLLMPADVANDNTPDITFSDKAQGYLASYVTPLYREIPGYSRLQSLAEAVNRDIAWSVIDPDGT
jgi:phosphatidylserine/phosphatidylglycerophosphate/cardiolipin synthase-like enzyme